MDRVCESAKHWVSTSGKYIWQNGSSESSARADRERVGYLAEDTVRLLRRYLRDRGRPRQGPLFESRHGTRLSYSMAWMISDSYNSRLTTVKVPG